MNTEDLVGFIITNIAWQEGSKLEKEQIIEVRRYFITDNDGKMFKGQDLHDILQAWMQDEFGECPASFEVEPV